MKGFNIMKRLFAVFLVALMWASPVSASHHRGHAVDHLDHGCKQLRFARANLNNWEASLLNPDPNFFSRTRNNLELTITECEEVADLLLDPSENLDVLRRRLNQPTTNPPISASRTIFFALYEVAFTVVGTQGANYDQFHRLNRRMQQGWADIDLAIWHVIDAIREEVYDDPDFQE